MQKFYLKTFILGLVFSLLCTASSVAQNSDSFNIQFNYKLNEESSDFKLERLRYYASNPIFKNNKNEIISRSINQYFLVDHEEEDIPQLGISAPKLTKFDSICFTLGIDSLTNANGVGEGDLDPTFGMYWTWQSGYINFKLEGTSAKSNARRNEVTYHLGGFLYGMKCEQLVCIATKDNKSLSITLDLDFFLKQIDIATLPYLMSPKKEAVLLSSLIAQSFKIIQQ